MESADKPGSVADSHSSGMHVTAHLVRPTRKPRGPRECFPIWSCSRRGLPCREVLPLARCALTAPFHPCRRREALGRSDLCGTFRRLAPPRGYLAPCPVEPGLSSVPKHRDCLADSNTTVSGNCHQALHDRPLTTPDFALAKEFSRSVPGTQSAQRPGQSGQLWRLPA